jgi:hypothetical protein
VETLEEVYQDPCIHMGVLQEGLIMEGCSLYISAHYTQPNRGRRGRDRMVVGYTTTCTISAYHH